MGDGAAAAVDALRARIAAIEGIRVGGGRAPSGVGALDAVTGGLPAPGLVALHGEVGSGRSRLAAAVLAACAAGGRSVAWIDGARQLHPPALAELGIPLDALLIVRPPAGHAVWAAEQVLASGCFPRVAISGVERVGVGGQRWARAAEQGRATALIVVGDAGRDLPAALRLRVEGERFTVLRDRGGAFGRQGALPAVPASARPWRRAQGGR
jgi:recombination protein RecA